MHFAKTIFFAVIGMGYFAFAAPIESVSAADASVAVSTAPADL